MAANVDAAPAFAEVAALAGHEDRAWHAEWSRDGNLLASCGADRTVRVWQRHGAAWREASRLEDAHDRTVRRCAWSPCGRLLAAASFDATCCVWRRDGATADWEILSTLEGHENEVKCAAWSASAMLLATCSRDKSVWLWEFVDDEAFELLTVLHGHAGDVKAVCFDLASQLRDDDLLASCSYDDAIRVWGDDGDDWSCRAVLEGHGSTVWDVQFCADAGGNRRLVSCGADGAVRVWAEASPGDAGAWTCLAALAGVHARPALSCAVAGRFVATGGADDALVLSELDPASGALARLGGVAGAHAGDVNSARWNPADPTEVATAGDDGVVRVWRRVAG